MEAALKSETPIRRGRGCGRGRAKTVRTAHVTDLPHPAASDFSDLSTNGNAQPFSETVPSVSAAARVTSALSSFIIPPPPVFSHSSHSTPSFGGDGPPRSFPVPAHAPAPIHMTCVDAPASKITTATASTISSMNFSTNSSANSYSAPSIAASIAASSSITFPASSSLTSSSALSAVDDDDDDDDELRVSPSLHRIRRLLFHVFGL